MVPTVPAPGLNVVVALHDVQIDSGRSPSTTTLSPSNSPFEPNTRVGFLEGSFTHVLVSFSRLGSGTIGCREANQLTNSALTPFGMPNVIVGVGVVEVMMGL